MNNNKKTKLNENAHEQHGKKHVSLDQQTNKQGVKAHRKDL